MCATQRVSKPFLIGVAGGTASGKSTVCQKIMAKLGQDCQRRVALIKQDSFYRQLSSGELALARKGCFNFDHPDAIDDQAMHQALSDILAGQPVRLPIHDYQDNRARPGDFYEVQSADVVLFEGVLIFYFPKVRDMFHMKLFVDTDSDTRLSRRVVRDVRERARPLEVVLNQYDQFVKPAFEEFCLPTKKYADMIIPRGAENEVAIGLINHNVTFLLASDLPNGLRIPSAGAYRQRPSPVSPAYFPARSGAAPEPLANGHGLNTALAATSGAQVEPLADAATGQPAHLPAAGSLAPRSRSNSYVLSAAAAAEAVAAAANASLALPRRGPDITEE